MRVGTYPTRNFATLGPSELRPPFTGASFQCLHIFTSPSSTGQVSDPIRRVTTLQSPVFLVNSRHPLFCVTFFFNKFAKSLSFCSRTLEQSSSGLGPWLKRKRSSLFRSYGGNLPSSFNIILSTPACIYTSVGLSTVNFCIFTEHFLVISWIHEQIK